MAIIKPVILEGGQLKTAGVGDQVPQSFVEGLDTALEAKVDKVAGKGLSDTNYTQAEKTKLAGIATEATKNRADSENADKVHTHTMAQVTGLDSALAGKASNTDPRLTDSREWSEATVPQAEAEAGTASTRRAWTAQRVRQAINAWWQLVTSGFGRNFIAASNEQAARNVLQLGTAATVNLTTSSTDETVGRVLKVGDFGVGAPTVLPAGTDLNTFTINGVYDVSGAVNRPTGIHSWGYLRVSRHSYNNNYCYQEWTELDRVNPRTYYRTRSTGVWGSWIEIHNTSNGASAAEVQAGTDTEKWISPATLSSRTATETRTGLVEKATTAEVLAGAADKYPDAAGVVQCLANWSTLISTGNFVEAGRGSGSVSLTVNDGGGNASIAFNHRGCIPDSDGSSVRITTSVDDATAGLSITMADNVTAGVIPNVHPTLAVNLNNISYRGSEIYRRANIVGPVGQSSGVPTGAIIARGSNTNGQYVRFADGTQIAWVELSVNGGQNIPSGGVVDTSFNYPVAFIGSPRTSVTTSGPTIEVIRAWTQIQAAVGRGGTFFAFRNTGPSPIGNGWAQIIWVGRWF